MKLTFWGTRGSIATPGRKTVRYGGNTPCIELRLSNNQLFILDAGTGIRNLGERLMETEEHVKAYLFISHPHWDHIQGFPFFKPAFIAGNEITIVGGENDKVTLHKMIADQMNKIYFPIRINELEAKLDFRRVDEETTMICGAEVQTMYVNHPSFAIGYRITHEGKTVVYISDNEPFDRSVAREIGNVESVIVDKYLATDGDPNNRVFEFVKNADVLIHDATYTPEEYRERIGWGHSPYDFALRVAASGKVKQLILFHHDPSHDDGMIDSIVGSCKEEIRRCGYDFECHAAAEEMTIEI